MNWKIVVSLFVLVLGISGQIFYDFYYTPIIAARDVVVAAKDIENYRVLTADDIKVEKVPIELVPSGALTRKQDAVGKLVLVPLTENMILTRSLIDSDEFVPGADEGIFAIPENVIFAVNGSLRPRDKVDIFLVPPEKSEVETLRPEFEVIPDVPVVHVRSKQNNDVLDPDGGTSRTNSTATVAYPEVKLKKARGEYLLRRFQEGYKVWIVRVS